VAVVERRDRSRAPLVVALGLREPALLLRATAQLVVGAGRAVAVVEGELDLERLLVVALGLREPALILRRHAQLVVGAGRAVRSSKARKDLERLLVVGPSASANRRCSCAHCLAGGRS
jgi:hypothetical protein